MANAESVKQPWFGGARTLTEQMMGLDPALSEAPGKTILDAGCAEGAISLEFVKAGAKSVLGLDYKPEFIEVAQAELAKAGRNWRSMPVEFRLADIAEIIKRPERPQFDIVLALAILHKLPDPAAGVRLCAECATSLIVIRLPKGSTGKINGKQYPHRGANIPAILTECGFKRERKEMGPRGEWVQYFRRVV